jgi:hypothetical protein
VQRVPVAVSAILFQFQAVGVRPLVLGRRVISLLAVRAGERDEDPHSVHLPESCFARSTDFDRCESGNEARRSAPFAIRRKSAAFKDY